MDEDEDTVGRELERHGIPGPSFIRNALSKTRKTNTLINAVKKFQNENGIKNPNIGSALMMLDMHNVRRTECFSHMITDSRNLLIQRIRALGAEKSESAKKKLEKQLDKCFKMYKIPEIRPIVLETLKQLPKLSDSYVEKIVSDTELYQEAAISVKQQVWIRHIDLFVAACRPVMDDYVKAKRAVICMIDPCPTNFFSCETTRSRRQFEQIQTLVLMFGDLEPLYKRLMQLIRESYLESGDSIYCSMKLEVIMAAHDASSDSVVKGDPSHELAWCLDMCLRDKHIDVQQTVRLKNMLEACKKHAPEIVGDISMVAADPHVLHFLSTMGVKLLRDATVHIPREQPGFQLIVRLLSFGCAAHKIVETLTVPTQMVDTIFFTKFASSFASLIMEDVMRHELTRNDMSEEADKMGLYSAPSDTILTFLRADPAAGLLWLHYTVDLLPRRSLDIKGMLRYLRLMPTLKDQMAVHAPWSHLLIHRMLTSPLVETLINDHEMISIVVDRLFLSNLRCDRYVKYQLLRIINQMHRVLHPTIGAGIMEHISPQTLADAPDAEIYGSYYAKTLAKVLPKEEEPKPAFVPPAQPNQMMAATPARVPPATPHQF